MDCLRKRCNTFLFGNDALTYTTEFKSKNGTCIMKNSFSYEMSEDLKGKEAEMLERTYGGYKCHAAACIIQRAYRLYSMQKNFKKICEKRKSTNSLFIAIPETVGVEKKQDVSTVREPSSSSFISTEKPDIIEKGLDLPSINFEHFIESDEEFELKKSFSKNGKSVHLSEEILKIDESPKITEKPTPRIATVVIIKSAETLPLTDKYSMVLPSTPNSAFIVNTVNKEKDTNINSNSKLATDWPNNDSIYCEQPHISAIKDKDNLRKIKGDIPCDSCYDSTDKNSPSSPGKNSDPAHCGSPVWKRKFLCPTDSSKKCTELIARQKLTCEHEIGSKFVVRCLNDVDKMPRQCDKEMRGNVTFLEKKDLSNLELNETYRKRCYRIGLNLFNRKPERGLRFLIQQKFIENTPEDVAKLLMYRKGLNRQVIGEYLGNIRDKFAMETLRCFARLLDMRDLPVDMALREFQCHFRLPGEAQKIEKIMEVFGKQYAACNPDKIKSLRNPETIVVLAYAIIMLNTDLHNRSVKNEKKMRFEQFVNNLKGIDDGADIDISYLQQIYYRVKTSEFRILSDHTTQVLKIEQKFIGKKFSLNAPHRRLICFCRLYEVTDINKKEKPNLHQREVFLFNDLLVVTKIFQKKKDQSFYNVKNVLFLCGMNIFLFETPNYKYGMKLTQKPDNKILITLNARNAYDRENFCEDLKETILEVDEMEAIRLQNELDRHKIYRNLENRSANNKTLKTSAFTGSRTFSSSLLNLDVKPIACSAIKKYGSDCSLDSGMISLQDEYEGAEHPSRTCT